MTMTPLTPDVPQAELMTWMTFSLPVGALAELKDHAHASRISASELVRRRVLGLPAPRAAVPQVNSQIYADLGRVGNNLNQLTKLAHESGQPQLQPLARALVELKTLLDKARLEVIGADQADEEGQE